MAYFLAFQTTYNHFEMGLFYDNKLLHHIKKDRSLTSKYITLFIDELLQAQTIQLKDISFFAANIGPAPITTLRVILATLNGLSFSTTLPLIGIDGLIEFLHAHQRKDGLTIALFNAFSDDVFYAYDKIQGCKNIDTLLQELKIIKNQQNLCFIGQGALLFQEKIKEYFGNQTVILHEPHYITLEQLGHCAWKNWQEKNIHNQIFPLYIKKREYISL